MNQKQYLLKGTFILTAAGLLSRIAGFFYKIFLSRTVGAEIMGIHQLILPVYAFCAAAAFGGIQTAVSKHVSADLAKGAKREAWNSFLAGLFLSLLGALFCSLLLFSGSGWIASVFLGEPRCSPLLKILSVSLPFAAVHSCVSGYLVGQKKVLLPALSQLAEQIFRILFSFLLYFLFLEKGYSLSAAIIVLGQAAGEAASAASCFLFLALSPRFSLPKKKELRADIRATLSVSLPLSSSRMLLGVLQGIEAALLPLQLRKFGLTASQALSEYGTFSGMALPLILFPTAITGSLGTLLLPAVSEAKSSSQNRQLHSTIEASFLASLYLGFFCVNAFLLFGDEAGRLLFDSPAAGEYIVGLSFLCPFLYTNNTLSSILHGLGKTGAVSFLHSFSFVLRLLFVVLLVPAVGIEGYLYGVLLGQIFLSVSFLALLFKSTGYMPEPGRALLLPLSLCLSATGCMYLIRTLGLVPENTWAGFFLEIFLYLAAFLLPGSRLFLLRNRSR